MLYAKPAFLSPESVVQNNSVPATPEQKGPQESGFVEKGVRPAFLHSAGDLAKGKPCPPLSFAMGKMTIVTV
jgi:hypothetical protein